MIREIYLLVAITLAVYGQSSTMRAPLLGYVFDDNAKAIRAISGVPGATSPDDVVALNTSITSAFIHSRARVAVVNTKEGAVGLAQWNGSSRVISLATALKHVSFASFSPSGDRVAISDGAFIEVWSGIANNPVQTGVFAPDGAIAALATNQDGSVAAASNGNIVLLSGDSRVIASGGQWTAMAFLPDGKDLLAADRRSGTLKLIRDVANSATSSNIADLDQQTGAIAVSSDGILAAVATSNAATIVDLSAGTVRSVTCKCQPSTFAALAGNLVLQIKDAQSGSLWLLDADRPTARIIPLLPSNGGATQ